MGRFAAWYGLPCWGLFCVVGCGGRVDASPEGSVPTNKGGAGSSSGASTFVGSPASSSAGAAGTLGSMVTASGGVHDSIVMSFSTTTRREPCGDMRLGVGEECDDGNRVSGDGCSETCQLEAIDCPTDTCVERDVCGNGRLSANEACDDANTAVGDGCNFDCRYREPGWICPRPGHACATVCGDSVVAGLEQCDEGPENGAYKEGLEEGCSHECRIVPSCILDGSPSPCPEACNGTTTAERPSYCPGICGDGIKDWNEQCDEGADNKDDTYGSCNTHCQYGHFCGDGVRDESEECDLGDMNTFAYERIEWCSSICEITRYCGDGRLDWEFGEQCDVGPPPQGGHDLVGACIASTCVLWLP